MKSIYKRLKKKALLSLLVIHLSLMSFATSYYVSNSGNDSNSGITASQAWQTLTKVNMAIFKAGDQILFERGSEFYGSLTIKNSGTSGNPITFGAYGSGSNPVITGFTTVISWTNKGGNIWESTNAVSTLTKCNMVTINGANTPMGRTPNTGYHTYQGHTTTSISSSNLSGTPNWTGAYVAFKINDYTLGVDPITSQSGNTITFTKNDKDADIGYNGQKFIIQNDIRTLDVQNEWYYDRTTKKLSIYSTTQPTNVKVSSIDILVTLSGKDYVTFDGVDFSGSNVNTFYIQSSEYITVQNSNILFSGKDAFFGKYVSGSSHISVINCVVDETNRLVIDFPRYFTNSIIRGNTINNTGMIFGASSYIDIDWNATGTSTAISITGDNTLIEKNVITNTGGNAIVFNGNNTIIQNNYVDGACSILHDGGGIYTWNGSNTVHSGMKILNNIVANVGSDNGIYLDDGTNGIEVSGNSVVNNNVGIYVHNCFGASIANNTTYNNAYVGLLVVNDIFATTMSGVSITGNKFIAKGTDQLAMHLWPVEKINPVVSFKDNYYSRPIQDILTIDIRFDLPSYDYKHYTLAQWQSYSGQDANSKKSPQTILSLDDLLFGYNATTASKTVSLSKPMIDITGKKYVGSIVLAPYTSIVLMKDNNPVIPTTIYYTEYKSICDGLSYNGWTQTGKYERSFIAKSGADSVVTTYLTVNPKYTVTEDITINNGESYFGLTTSGQYTRTLNSISGCDSIVTTNLTVVVNTGKEGSIEYSQTLLLKKGNNLISSYLTPENPDIAAIANSLCTEGALYKMQDEAGKSLEYWGRYGGWVNKIGNLLPTEGYNVNVKFDCSLLITGNLISLPLDISLKKGWNFISFPQTDNINALFVVQSLIDQNKLVKVQDEKGNSIEKLNGLGWVNNIGNFSPGKGYKVYVNGGVNLTILQSYPKSGTITVEDVNTQYFSTVYEGNGISHMNINIVGLSESGLSVGDELGAYDGNICVGALKINENHLISGYASLVSSYSTDDQIQNGFKDGDQILIYVWDKRTGEKRLVQPEVLDGDLLFAQNASSLIAIKSLTTDISPLTNEIQIDVYPNPTHGNFTVRLNEIPELGGRIDILDISGKAITSRVILNRSEVFEIPNKASGMYFVKTVIGTNQSIHKLIVN